MAEQQDVNFAPEADRNDGQQEDEPEQPQQKRQRQGTQMESGGAAPAEGDDGAAEGGDGAAVMNDQEDQAMQQQEEDGANAAPAAAAGGEAVTAARPPWRPALGALVRALRRLGEAPDGDSIAAFAMAMDNTVMAVLDCLIQSGRVADDDGGDLIALVSFIMRPLPLENEQLACKVAEALERLVRGLTVRSPVDSTTVLAMASAAVPPLVAMMTRNGAEAAASAAEALDALHKLVWLCAPDEDAVDSDLRCEAFSNLVVQQGGALTVLLRTADLGIAAGGERGRRVAASALAVLSMSLEMCTEKAEAAASVAADAAAIGTLLRALQLAPSKMSLEASRALVCLLTSHPDQASGVCSALSTEVLIAALVRQTKAAVRDSLERPLIQLLRAIYLQSPDTAFSLFERQGVLEAAAYGLPQLHRSAFLTCVARTAGHEAAVASAVAAALYACPPGEKDAAARQRLRTFLEAAPLSLSPIAIDALLRSAREAARLRAEVAVLEAMPINTRAAIVELAAAMRSKP